MCQKRPVLPTTLHIRNETYVSICVTHVKEKYVSVPTCNSQKARVYVSKQTDVSYYITHESMSKETYVSNYFTFWLDLHILSPV